MSLFYKLQATDESGVPLPGAGDMFLFLAADGKLYLKNDSNDVKSVVLGVENKQLIDDDGAAVFDWRGRVFRDGVAIVSIDLNNRQLIDVDEQTTIDWTGRKLQYAGVTSVEWAGSTLGFFAKSPVSQPASSGTATAGVLYTATEQAMLQQAYNALRALGLMS